MIRRGRVQTPTLLQVIVVRVVIVKVKEPRVAARGNSDAGLGVVENVRDFLVCRGGAVLGVGGSVDRGESLHWEMMVLVVNNDLRHWTEPNV